MPKLLIINITCNQGSTGKISEQIGLMMMGRGWDVYLAHGARRVNPSQLKTFSFSSIKDEYLHALKSLFFDADGLGSTNATMRLVGQIEKIKPDVIHIHNLHGYYLNYKVLFEYLIRTGIPVVMTLHDCWSFTGHCVHFIALECDKWKYGCKECALYNVYPKRSIIDRSARNYRLKKELIANYSNLTIVTVSEWLGAMAKQSIYKNRNIQVINNGVDLNVFKPHRIEHFPKFTIIAVANVWHRDKGLYDFIELSKYLKDDEQIILVGYDEKKQKIKLPDNIIPVACTNNQEELAKLYCQSDVVVSMSYAETFGLTIAEGAACGTPGIVYDNTAQPALILEGTGYIVKTGNVKAVYDAICKIKEKGKKTYFDACITKAQADFDKDKCFEKYCELYENVLERY